jgi:hypothetical protein
MTTRILFACTLSLMLLASCASQNEADRVGVGAECTNDSDCPIVECDVEPCPVLACLRQFSGGYCGLSNCTADVQCPLGSACVAHTDGTNYCFRLCSAKPECNARRSPDVEANCSASVEFIEPQTFKACVPPSSGI